MFLLEVRQGCHKSVDVDRVILYILKNCNMHIYIYIVIHTHTYIYIHTMRVLYLCNAIYKYNTYMCINVTTIIELCFIVFLQRPANWQAARGDVFRQGW